MREQISTLLLFRLDDQRFGIPLQKVHHVVRAVAIISIPDLNEVLYGVIDYHGEVIPVVNLRKRFMMREKPLSLNDRFIIVSTERRKLALVVDEADGVVDTEKGELSIAGDVFSGIQDSSECPQNEHAAFLYRDENGIVVIHDLEKLLSSEMEIQLDKIVDIR